MKDWLDRNWILCPVGTKRSSRIVPIYRNLWLEKSSRSDFLSKWTYFHSTDVRKFQSLEKAAHWKNIQNWLLYSEVCLFSLVKSYWLNNEHWFEFSTKALCEEKLTSLESNVQSLENVTQLRIRAEIMELETLTEQACFARLEGKETVQSWKRGWSFELGSESGYFDKLWTVHGVQTGGFLWNFKS